MPPYTSLWLQSLFEIKGTAAWLRTGEASPASEWGREGRAVRGSPAQNAEGTHPAEVATPTGGRPGVRVEHQAALGLAPMTGQAEQALLLQAGAAHFPKGTSWEGGGEDSHPHGLPQGPS